ncbi:MAG TPA: glycosyltransferase family 39 protein [Candidatus Nanoarchaeia archaeon]|nr:glycosyltransferase family 39 protein [Candidatus Nanoarchaeia archaeon]
MVNEHINTEEGHPSHRSHHHASSHQEPLVQHHEQVSPHHEPFSEQKKNAFDLFQKARVYFQGKERKIGLYAILLFFVVIGTVLIRLKYLPMESIWNDAAVHLWYAQKLIMHPLSTLLWPTYYLEDYAIPQTITAFYSIITGNISTASELMILTYCVLGVILIYLLGKELRDKFTGLMAAILLSVNHIYYFYTIRPLGDAPLLVSVIFLMYSLVKLEKEQNMKWGIILGLSFLITLLHKVQSVLFILAILVYYLLFKRKEMFLSKPYIASWVIPWGAAIVASIVAAVFLHTKLLGRVFGLFLQLRGMPFGLEAAGMLKWIFSWYLIPFVLMGIALVIIYRQRIFYGPLVLGVCYWLFFEVNVDNTQDRYMLPLLPLAIILAVFTLTELASFAAGFTTKKFASPLKFLLVLGAVFFIAQQSFVVADSLAYGKSFTFLGYQEAGQWLKENAPDDAIIFAGSPRSIRAFVGREYYNEGHEDSPIVGGPLWWLRGDRYLEEFHPDDAKQNFEEDLAMLVKDHDIFLEIDVWEYTQPKWYWPVSQQSIDYFLSQGFQIVHVVEREVPTEKGMQKMPVIFLFKKDRVAG